MPTRNVIIDCDTGVDDALALLLALRSPVFNVLGISTVAGNVPLDLVVTNTLTVVEQAGRQVPVYRGQARPLAAPLQTTERAHGRNGLAGLTFLPPRLQARAEPAVDWIIHTYMQTDAPIEMITTGPLTNLATALQREPLLAGRIASLVMMAGSIANGNTMPSAEFNVWADPEAADTVFRSSIPKKMVPLQPIMEHATLTASEMRQLAACGSPWCQMSWQLLEAYRTRNKGAPSPCDPAAMAVALDDSIAVCQMYHVAIETSGEYTRGMTMADRRTEPEAAPANVNVVLRIDTQRYRRLFVHTLLGE